MTDVWFLLDIPYDWLADLARFISWLFLLSEILSSYICETHKKTDTHVLVFRRLGMTLINCFEKRWPLGVY